eukprot:scaffold8588_cov63-Phaeocystis_antarctica.AAC.3
MKVALLFAAVWNSAVCFVASVTSSLADARVFLPMERIDTLGVAGSKTGRVMTAVRVMRKTVRVEDMMCPVVAARRCARQWCSSLAREEGPASVRCQRARL